MLAALAPDTVGRICHREHGSLAAFSVFGAEEGLCLQ